MFKENLNTVVFTTRFVIEENSPILFVFHFDDGNWQFSGSEENLLDQDYRIISLGEMIEHDKSIIELAAMPINSQASRLNADSPWRVINKN